MSPRRAVKGWIVVSTRGYPAPFAGWAVSRKILREAYRIRFGVALEAQGYRAVRVTMTTRFGFPVK
jgi:hypothetical protein